MKILVTIMFVALTLAGCAGESGDTDPEEAIIDKGDVDLRTTGAISGLLVDDRFRPIDLEDKDASGEYQAIGFILVQETGQRLKTNENGEFQVLNLDAGTYTLRISAEGHEAIPQKVKVTIGEFSEVTVTARRVSSAGGTLITREYSIFIACAASAPVISTVYDCTFDQSGDSNRPGFSFDLQEYGTSISYLIHEMKAANAASPERGAYKVIVRQQGDGQYYGSAFTINGDYLYFRNSIDEISPIDTENRNVAWKNDRPMEVIMFPQGAFKSETGTAMNLVLSGESRGLGPQIGVRAQFIQSLFLGEPDVDIESYCVLC